VDAAISGDTFAARLDGWKAPSPRYRDGVFAKYCALVSSAADGAITRAPLN
jgi:dihydroxy-acid dehydratase